MRVSVCVVAVGLVISSSSPSHAVELTVSPASSLEAVPAGRVDRAEMSPPEGVDASTGDEPIFTHFTRQKRAETASTAPFPGRIPIPEFNPVSVSYCTVETQ